jgi:Holliday junction DNA helicase RuvA
VIEFIQGELSLKGANYLIVQTGGIAYRLNCPSLTLAKLPAVGEEVTIFTYLHVREDDLSLYGFYTVEEREMFLALMQVSGIGPKLALAILSHLSVQALSQAIVFGDIQPFLGVPGVGKKTAGRILLELKDKIGKEMLAEEMAPEAGAAPVPTDVRSEAVTALLALGYSVAEAQKAVPVVRAGEEATVEDLLRIAFKKLARV